jgi:hypothetical protein
VQALLFRESREVSTEANIDIQSQIVMGYKNYGFKVDIHKMSQDNLTIILKVGAS